MFRLFIDPGWVLYAYALDGLFAMPRMGSITWALYTWWAQCFLCSRVFYVFPWTGIDFFCYPLGSRIWFSLPVFSLYRFSFRMISCSYFILLFYKYLLLWVLVFCKLRRLSGQPAEAKAQAYGACFEGLRDIEKLFEGLQQMGSVRQGRVGRSRLSCRSYVCTLYLQFLLQSSKSASAINCEFYAFKWLHQAAEVD